jgi:Ca2+-binding EF-hand superfamily protein
VTVDEDRSGQITATELQKALVNGNWTPFDLDTTKMLMGIFVSHNYFGPFALARTCTDRFGTEQDVDHSGSINFNEFAGLWKYIADWQK